MEASRVIEIAPRSVRARPSRDVRWEQRDCFGVVCSYLTGLDCSCILRNVCRDWRKVVERNGALSRQLVVRDFSRYTGPFASSWQDRILEIGSHFIYTRPEELRLLGSVPQNLGVYNFWEFYSEYQRFVRRLSFISQAHKRVCKNADNVWSCLTNPVCRISGLAGTLAVIVLQGYFFIRQTCTDDHLALSALVGPTWTLVCLASIVAAILAQLYLRRYMITSQLSPIIDSLSDVKCPFVRDKGYYIQPFSFDDFSAGSFRNRGEMALIQLNLFLAVAIPNLVHYHLGQTIIAVILLFLLPLPGLIALRKERELLSAAGYAWTISTIVVACFWLGTPDPTARWLGAVFAITSVCMTSSAIRQAHGERNIAVDCLICIPLIVTAVGVMLFSISQDCISAVVSSVFGFLTITPWLILKAL